MKIKLQERKIKNLSKGGALCGVLEILGINVPMKYIGGSYTYFCYHTEDKDLASISYLQHGPLKVCYVCPAAHMPTLKAFALRIFSICTTWMTLTKDQGRFSQKTIYLILSFLKGIKSTCHFTRLFINAILLSLSLQRPIMAASILVSTSPRQSTMLTVPSSIPRPTCIVSSGNRL